jgi:hypothetical protein
MFKIRMNLQNPNNQTQIRPVPNAMPLPNAMAFSNANMSLNSGMIGRIHKTKPGCSSCGKKVY